MAKRKLISITNFSGSRDRSDSTIRLTLTLVILVFPMATQQCTSNVISVADNKGQRQSHPLGGDGGPETGKAVAMTRTKKNETAGGTARSSYSQAHTKINGHSQTVGVGEKDERHFDGTRKPRESASTLNGGQLEAFSTEWTGLGDLEASDALKKMNRRSLYESGSLPAPDRLSSFRVLRGRRRREPQTILSKRAQLYALQRQQQVEAPTNDRLLGPIVLSRRTSENLLDQPQQQVRVEDTEDKETFPLFGEFGSRISSLTTRKIEPSSGAGDIFGTNRALGFGGPMNYGLWSSNDNDDADENLPISSQLLMSPQRLDSIRESVEDALAAIAGQAGQVGGSVQNEAAQQFSRNGEINKPETVSTIMESLSSNYLPRIARKAPHSVNMGDG